MSTNGVGKNVVICFKPVEKTLLMVWSHIASPGHKNFFRIVGHILLHLLLSDACLLWKVAVW